MADPRIRYDINASVTGASDVEALARQIESLGETLEGDLKTKAAASAAALRELGAKQTAIDTFVNLKREAGDAAQRLNDAQAAAQKLGREMSATAAPTKAQTGQMAKLRDEVKAAKAEVTAKAAALDTSRASLRQYGLSADNLAQAERNVKAALNASRAEIQAMIPAYGSAASAAKASAATQQQAVRTVGDELAGLRGQLETLRNIAGLALGGSMVGSLAKDVAQTADEYANLAARVKLATGEGQLFEESFEGVQRVAQATNSTLEATGTLFARLSDASKQAGLDAAAAAGQALNLTETINQAVQLSGASAQASDAALVQLIQGLQSGVLRGEEFNSVMEQAPRLAKALADGLGVTTGALRKMAGEGQLTTQVVIDAIKSQSDTIRSEFETLPPTVGRALQNLSTAWTIYVGETDKATGASKTAAQAIDALARNLDTLAGLLLDVGQAAAAFAALRLAQTFLGIGAAATTSAAAVAANTTAMTAAGAAGATAAVGVGRFAAAQATLRAFTLVGLVANFKDIGTWIGESVARLQGYKDLSADIEKAEKSRLAIAAEHQKIVDAQAAANRAAAESQFELSKSARASLAEFEKLTAEGGRAAEAVAKIGQDFDLSTAPGIQDAAAVLDKLAADGKISADQFRAAWAEAFKGVDLQVFEVNARTAFAGATRGAERLSAALDASLREAIRRSGADFDVLSGSMSKAARSAINDLDTIVSGLDRLKDQGVDTARLLEASIGRAIKTADSQAAVAALRERVQQLRQTLGERVTDGFLQQLDEKARATTGSLSDLEAALRKLGIASDESLKKAAADARALYDEVVRTGGSAREQAQAFERMARAAIESGDETALSFARARAAAHGLEIATDAAGRTTVRAMGEGRAAAEALSASLESTTKTAEQLDTFMQRLAARNRAVVSSLRTDAQGFAVDAQGNRVVQAVDNRESVAQRLQNMGLDAATASRLAAQVYGPQGQYTPMSAGGRPGETLDALLQRLVSRQQGGAARVGASPSSAPTPPGAPSPAPEPTRTVRVEIAVNGYRTESLTTDDEGAAALVRALKNAGLNAGF